MFVEPEILSNPNHVTIMFAITEADASKAVGVYDANVLKALKAPDANKPPDHFGAKVGLGTHLWNYAKNLIYRLNPTS